MKRAIGFAACAVAATLGTREASAQYYEVVAAAGYPWTGNTAYWSVNGDGTLHNTDKVGYEVWVVPLPFASAAGTRNWSVSVWISENSNCRLFVIPTTAGSGGVFGPPDVGPKTFSTGTGPMWLTLPVMPSSFNGAFLWCSVKPDGIIGNVQWSY